MENGTVIRVLRGVILHVHSDQDIGFNIKDVMRGNNSVPFCSRELKLLLTAFPALAEVSNLKSMSFHSVIRKENRLLSSNAYHSEAVNYYLAPADSTL